MEKKIIEGVVVFDDDSYSWMFKASDVSYSSSVCLALDEILNCTTCDGDKYKITIKQI